MICVITNLRGELTVHRYFGTFEKCLDVCAEKIGEVVGGQVSAKISDNSVMAVLSSDASKLLFDIIVLDLPVLSPLDENYLTITFGSDKFGTHLGDSIDDAVVFAAEVFGRDQMICIRDSEITWWLLQVPPIPGVYDGMILHLDNGW